MSTSFDLSGKTALVTGAAGVLGRRFCAGLAGAGANVAAVDLNRAAVEELAAALERENGRPCVGVACDVTDPRAVEAMIGKVLEIFGRLDIAHSNAATKTSDLGQFFDPLESYSMDTWRAVMAVNLDGMFLVCRAAGTAMARSGRGGSIIMTSSIYGMLAPDARIYEASQYLGRQINTPAVYAASKAGVIGLARYLSAYWAAHNVRVNALTPGGVESGQNEAFQRAYSARVPLGRMAQADEIVGAMLFLASDASSYVTGQNLVVDGGLSAW